jgi:hypothetical protein
MALSTRKKNTIIADIKAGRYNTITALCKQHKIDRKTYYKICGDLGIKFGQNSDIVEAGVILENAKSQLKTPQEVHSVNKAIEERMSTIEIDNKLIETNRQIARLLQKKVIEQKDDIELSNIKNISSTIKDIESIANPKTNDTNVQVNTQVINEIKVKFE